MLFLPKLGFLTLRVGSATLFEHRSTMEAWRFHDDASKTAGASPTSSDKWWRLAAMVDEDGDLRVASRAWMVESQV